MRSDICLLYLPIHPHQFSQSIINRHITSLSLVLRGKCWLYYSIFWAAGEAFGNGGGSENKAQQRRRSSNVVIEIAF